MPCGNNSSNEDEIDMRTSDLVRSKFFRGADLKGQPSMIMTISTVTEELMGRPGGKMEPKYFIWFHEDSRGLQCNKSRVAVLEHAYGPETDYWTDKKVRLSYDPTVMMAGQVVGGVKLTTPAGIVWDPSRNPHAAAWGDAPAPQGAQGGPSPPKPVLNRETGLWELPAQVVAAPVPVLNQATGQWELPAQKHVPPKTMGQRINEGHPPGAGTVNTATGEVDFDDEIPF
jgi:hypothetical protein